MLRKVITFFLVATVVTLSVGSSPTQGIARAGFACVVTHVAGDVMVLGMCGGPAREGAIIAVGARVTTGANGSITVMLADGTSVSAGPLTDFIVGPSGIGFSVGRLQSSGLMAPQIKIFIGSIWLEVTRRLQQGESFEVETPSSTIAVRGTSFRVDVDSARATSVYVESGMVVVLMEQGSVDVGPGQSIETTKMRGPKKTSPGKPKTPGRPPWAPEPPGKSNSKAKGANESGPK